jgi:hypothetical protein
MMLEHYTYLPVWAFISEAIRHDKKILATFAVGVADQEAPSSTYTQDRKHLPHHSTFRRHLP